MFTQYFPLSPSPWTPYQRGVIRREINGLARYVEPKARVSNVMKVALFLTWLDPLGDLSCTPKAGPNNFWSHRWNLFMMPMAWYWFCLNTYKDVDLAVSSGGCTIKQARLSLCEQCHEGGSLLTQLDHYGNLYSKLNLVRSRLYSLFSFRIISISWGNMLCKLIEPFVSNVTVKLYGKLYASHCDRNLQYSRSSTH